MKKFLVSLLLIFTLFGIMATVQNPALAYKYSEKIDDIEHWADDVDPTITDKTRSIAGNIIYIVQMVGTGIAVIMLTYLGTRYITLAPTEKADFKKSATGYIVGAIILFASVNIVAIISNFATKNIK